MGVASGAIRAGQAFVELFVNSDNLVKGLTQAQARMSAWAAGLSKLGASTMGGGLPEPFASMLRFSASPAGLFTGVLAASKVWASSGEELVHLSAKTGIALDSLQKLSYAAQREGIDAGTMATGIKKMQQALDKAAYGGSEAIQAFNRLGLSVGDLRRMKPEEQFTAIADRISKIENPTTRAALAIALFGRSGTEMLPLIMEGSEDLENAMKRFEKLGMMRSGESIKAAKEYNHAIEDMEKLLKGTVLLVGGAVAPIMKQFVERVIEIVLEVRKWIREQQELIASATRVAATIVTIGASAMVMSKMISTAVTLTKTIALISTPVGALITLIGVMAAAWLKAKANGTSYGEEVARIIEGVVGKGHVGQLDDNMAQQKKHASMTGEAEAGMREKSITKTNEALRRMYAEIQAMEARRKSEGLYQWEHDNLNLLTVNYRRLMRARAEALGSGGFTYASEQEEAAAKGKAKAIDDAAEAMKAYLHNNRELMGELAQLQLAGGDDHTVAGKLAVKLRETDQKYNQKKAQAEEKGEDPALIERARQQEIANIKREAAYEQADRDAALTRATIENRIEATMEGISRERALLQSKHAAELEDAAKNGQDLAKLREKQAAETMKLEASTREGNRNLDREIARGKIEATMTGLAKEKALLAERHREELEDAQRQGLDLNKVKAKQMLEDQAFLLQKSQTSVTGTFSGRLQGMGMGNATERIASHTEAAKNLLQQIKQVLDQGGAVFATN